MQEAVSRHEKTRLARTSVFACLCCVIDLSFRPFGANDAR